MKSAYNIGHEETVPFLAPLRGATEEELRHADRNWSEWIAMQDWMLGSRRPHSLDVQRRAHGLVMDDGRFGL